MKKVVLSAMALACAAGVASADVYSDAPFDIFDLGFPHLDITSVTITNDANWLFISVQNNGDLDATNWGKYGIGIDAANGPTTNGNAWGRNIDWGRGITHWSASWADDGGSGVGAETYHWDGGSWVLDGATWNGDTNIAGNDSLHFAGVQQWQIALSALGVGVGDTIEFDIITTGGGADPGVDHLSRADLATPGWGDTSVSGGFRSYTIVPSPASAALLGLGGLVGLRRRR